MVMLFFMGFSGYGQRPCPPEQVPCGRDNKCTDRRDCRGGPNPPPPGRVVPIDNHLSLLLAAGICLGVYCFVFVGRKSVSAD